MQNRKTKEDKLMETNFKNLTINFNSYSGIKKPDITSKSHFYKIYSPEKFKLRPRDDIRLDLKFYVKTPDRIKPWLNLLPLLRGLQIYIENEDWQNNLTKDNTIQLHLLHKSFNYTIQIKEKQRVGFIFLLGQKPSDKIVTKYNILI